MKATDVIRRDHKAALELINKYKNASQEEREEMTAQIFDALDTHEMMEDTKFYTALEDVVEDNAALAELVEEQAELTETMSRIKAMEGVEQTDALADALDTVVAHAQKEEKEILPLAEKALGEEQLNEIGEEMEPISAVALVG
ncbi:MAG: hemerythrin domain-containing protein [Patescibacteria group bacterium]|nr:hemerythrin domain-containing protein [Patescibacteria group bacterium]